MSEGQISFGLRKGLEQLVSQAKDEPDIGRRLGAILVAGLEDLGVVDFFLGAELRARVDRRFVEGPLEEQDVLGQINSLPTTDGGDER